MSSRGRRGVQGPWVFRRLCSDLSSHPGPQPRCCGDGSPRCGPYGHGVSPLLTSHCDGASRMRACHVPSLRQLAQLQPLTLQMPTHTRAHAHARAHTHVNTELAHQHGPLHLAGRGHLGQLGQGPLRVEHGARTRTRARDTRLKTRSCPRDEGLSRPAG